MMERASIRSVVEYVGRWPDNGRGPIPSIEVSGIRVDESIGGRAVLIDIPKTPDGQIPGRLVFAPHEARALVAAIEAACLIAEGAK